MAFLTGPTGPIPDETGDIEDQPTQPTPLPSGVIDWPRIPVLDAAIRLARRHLTQHECPVCLYYRWWTGEVVSRRGNQPRLCLHHIEVKLRASLDLLPMLVAYEDQAYVWWMSPHGVQPPDRRVADCHDGSADDGQQ